MIEPTRFRLYTQGNRDRQFLNNKNLNLVREKPYGDFDEVGENHIVGPNEDMMDKNLLKRFHETIPHVSFASPPATFAPKNLRVS